MALQSENANGNTPRRTRVLLDRNISVLHPTSLSDLGVFIAIVDVGVFILIYHCHGDC